MSALDLLSATITPIVYPTMQKLDIPIIYDLARVEMSFVVRVPNLLALSQQAKHAPWN
jgi:hypothetical protein